MDNQYNYNDSGNQHAYSTDFEAQIRIQEKIKRRMEKKNARKQLYKKAVAISCAAVLFGGVSAGTFVGVSYYARENMGIDFMGKQEMVTQSTMVANPNSATVNSDVATIAENVMPSIVSIINLSVKEVQSFFGSQYQKIPSAGSGIIIGQNDTELLILTNNHVVADSETLTVTFSNEDSIQAQIKGTQEAQDLAIISIKLKDISQETRKEMKIATLGDSDKLKVGEPVIAIGNALGYGQSVTTGVVSATGRTLDGIDSHLIQTDAAINPGNSGGALLNSNGEVIGINTAKVNQEVVEGMGYAIPISDASKTINSLMTLLTKEKVADKDRGYIGITGQSVTEEASMMYEIPLGVHIREVAEGGAAQKAGIVKGTIITAIDDTIVSNMESLQAALVYYAHGTKVVLTTQVLDSEGNYVEKKVELVLQKAQ